MPYNLTGYEFNLLVHFGSLGRTVNKNYETNSCIAMSIVDNKHLKWNFYLQANLGKIECINDGKNNLIYTHGKRYISNIKTNIYKIMMFIINIFMEYYYMNNILKKIKFKEKKHD